MAKSLRAGSRISREPGNRPRRRKDGHGRASGCGPCTRTWRRSFRLPVDSEHCPRPRRSRCASVSIPGNRTQPARGAARVANPWRCREARTQKPRLQKLCSRLNWLSPAPPIRTSSPDVNMPSSYATPVRRFFAGRATRIRRRSLNSRHGTRTSRVPALPAIHAPPRQRRLRRAPERSADRCHLK